MSSDRNTTVELLALNLNGSRQKFLSRVKVQQVGYDRAAGTDRVVVDNRDLGRADFSDESRDNHLAALAYWIATE